METENQKHTQPTIDALESLSKDIDLIYHVSIFDFNSGDGGVLSSIIAYVELSEIPTSTQRRNIENKLSNTSNNMTISFKDNHVFAKLESDKK